MQRINITDTIIGRNQLRFTIDYTWGTLTLKNIP